MSIPQSFIQELLARADVVEVVGRLRAAEEGQSQFSGLCPFTPKVAVVQRQPTKQFPLLWLRQERQRHWLFMDHAGMGFVEAVRTWPSTTDCRCPKGHQPPSVNAPRRSGHKQSTLTDVLEKAAEAYRKHLKDSPRAVAYFKGRGVSGAVAKQFNWAMRRRAGAAGQCVLLRRPAAGGEWPGDLQHGPKPGRQAPRVQPSWGGPTNGWQKKAPRKKRYDRFRDRVMFPIRNIRASALALAGASWRRQAQVPEFA